MALSGLDIYKLLPKTNCKDCGFPTCLAFAMQLAKKAVGIDKCPHTSAAVKAQLEAASAPSIRQVVLGGEEASLCVGNETVLFRHEEKFRNPAGIGFVIDDSASDAEIAHKVKQINELVFERIGQTLTPNLIAIRQTKDAQRFCAAVKLVAGKTRLALVLMSSDAAGVREALALAKGRRPLVWGADASNAAAMAALAKEHGAALAVCAKDIEGLAAGTQAVSTHGAQDIVLDIAAGTVAERIWELTQIRRLALKKSVRSLGYPTIAVVDRADPYEECLEAATYILKYGSIVLLRGTQAWQALSLLTLRQNIFTDPQKPLQIEPNVYPIGQAGKDSPVLVTTNFSLTYYTVVGEVEASKVPSYVISVDTEGMSVLTAWAAEKFTPEKISESLAKFSVADLVKQKRLIIPGYVAVMSGDLEERSGWKIVVGPKEAAGIPSFLKNLQ